MPNGSLSGQTRRHGLDIRPENVQVSGLRVTVWTIEPSLWSRLLQVRALPPEQTKVLSTRTTVRNRFVVVPRSLKRGSFAVRPPRQICLISRTLLIRGTRQNASTDHLPQNVGPSRSGDSARSALRCPLLVIPSERSTTARRSCHHRCRPHRTAPKRPPIAGSRGDPHAQDRTAPLQCTGESGRGNAGFADVDVGSPSVEGRRSSCRGERGSPRAVGRLVQSSRRPSRSTPHVGRPVRRASASSSGGRSRS